MKNYKIKGTVQKVFSKLQLTFSLPTTLISLLILISAILSIIISKYLYDIDSSFYSSVFSNIFAGLITGFALSILSGTKTVYYAYMEERHSWLEKTHTMILDFIKMHRELSSSFKDSAEIIFDKAYETGAHANWVNDRIMQATFDKAKWFDPPKYFLKKYDYDCIEMCEILSDFKESICSIELSITTRKSDLEIFQPVVQQMKVLDRKILSDMKDIEIKLTSARKTII